MPNLREPTDKTSLTGISLQRSVTVRIRAEVIITHTPSTSTACEMHAQSVEKSRRQHISNRPFHIKKAACSRIPSQYNCILRRDIIGDPLVLLMDRGQRPLSRRNCAYRFAVC